MKTMIPGARDEADEGMRSSRHIVLAFGGVAWLTAAAVGLGVVYRHEATPGPSSSADTPWPQASSVSPASDKPTLLMFVHPDCPCTRATIQELSRIVASCGEGLSVRVLTPTPSSSITQTKDSYNWRDAAAIPGVKVIVDADGIEAQRFGAGTSGYTLLYSPQGTLLFHGGITGSRGHEGDNAGRTAIVDLVLGAKPDVVKTPVFGCELFPLTQTTRDATGTCCES